MRLPDGAPLRPRRARRAGRGRGARRAPRRSSRRATRPSSSAAGPIGVLIATVARALRRRGRRHRARRRRRRSRSRRSASRRSTRATTDQVAWVEEWTGGAGADVVFEVSGAAAAVLGATALAKVRGTIVVVAIHPTPARDRPAARVLARAAHPRRAGLPARRTSRRPSSCIADGVIPADLLITDDRAARRDRHDAFADLEAGTRDEDPGRRAGRARRHDRPVRPHRHDRGRHRRQPRHRVRDGRGPGRGGRRHHRRQRLASSPRAARSRPPSRRTAARSRPWRVDFADRDAVERARRRARRARRSTSWSTTPARSSAHPPPSTRSTSWDRVLEVEPVEPVRAHPGGRPRRCSSAAAARSSSPRPAELPGRHQRARLRGREVGHRRPDQRAGQRVGRRAASTSTRSPPATSRPTTRRRCRTTRTARAPILERIPAGRWGRPDDLAGADRVPRLAGLGLRVAASCCPSTVAGWGDERRRRAARRSSASSRSSSSTTPRRAADLAEALLAGGIGCAEITLRTPAASRRSARRRRSTASSSAPAPCSPRGQVDECVDAGARFIVSPGLDGDVVDARSYARGHGDPGRRHGDRGAARVAPRPVAAQGLPGRPRWAGSALIERARRPVPRRPVRAQRRGLARRTRRVPRRPVRRGDQRQLDGAAVDAGSTRDFADDRAPRPSHRRSTLAAS